MFGLAILAQVVPEHLHWTTIVMRAFSTSDGVGKTVVALLLVFSVFAWSIIAYKACSMFAARHGCNRFLSRYDRVKSPIGMGLYLDELSGPMRNICAVGIEQLCEICAVPNERRANFLRHGISRQLTQAETDKIRAAMNRQVSVETVELEYALGFLGVFVTISPFLGLFGTVWGVMATFMEIAAQGRVELSAIAPGISGALLTTVCGLMVAIPSVFSNILINASVNKTCLQMDIFVEDFIASLKLESSQEGDAE